MSISNKSIIQSYHIASSRGYLDMMLRNKKYISSLLAYEAVQPLNEQNKSRMIHYLLRKRAKAIKKMIINDHYCFSGNYSRFVYSRIAKNYCRDLDAFSFEFKTFLREFKVKSAFRSLYRLKHCRYSLTNAPTNYELCNPNIEHLALDLTTEQGNNGLQPQHKILFTRFLSLAKRKLKLKTIHIKIDAETIKIDAFSQFLKELGKVSAQNGIELYMQNETTDFIVEKKFLEKFDLKLTGYSNELQKRDHNAYVIYIQKLDSSNLQELSINESYFGGFYGACTGLKKFTSLKKLSISQKIEQSVKGQYWEKFLTEFAVPDSLTELNIDIVSTMKVEGELSLANAINKALQNNENQVKICTQSPFNSAETNLNLKKFSFRYNPESWDKQIDDLVCFAVRKYKNIRTLNVEMASYSGYIDEPIDLSKFMNTFEGSKAIQDIRLISNRIVLPNSTIEKPLEQLESLNISGLPGQNKASLVKIQEIVKFMGSSLKLRTFIFGFPQRIDLLEVPQVLFSLQESYPHLETLDIDLKLNKYQPDQARQIDEDLIKSISGMKELKKLCLGLFPMMKYSVKRFVNYISKHRKMAHPGIVLSDISITSISQ